jgi:tripartite-type tricarboxylate transporter receptor subunit TctC
MKSFRKLVQLTASAVVAATLIAGIATPVMADYPERPIQLIVPWGAGGGTDATGRIIGSLLQKELGQPVNVINRTGGSGVIGHSAIANAKPDGYTLGVATVETGMMHWAGLTDLTYKKYTPIALFNSDYAGVIVREDSEWKNVGDVFAAAKAKPGDHKGSGTGQGGIWHLALAGMLKTHDLDPALIPWVPSKGSAGGLQELVAEGVDVVTCSIVEASGLLSAGKVKAIGIMAPERVAAFPDVPTLAESGGPEWEMASWRGIVAPAGLGDAEAAVLSAAMAKVTSSDEFKEFMNGRGFGINYLAGADFEKWMEKSDESLGAVMKAVGLAK